MLLDVWIYALPSEWDALILDTAVYTGAVTGYWNSFGAYEVYNTVGEPEEIQGLLDELTDVARVYAWSQGDGVDSLNPWPTDPNDILAVMQDIDGTPATFENPNWGHVFFGQTQRVFAGDFSNDFSEAFL